MSWRRDSAHRLVDRWQAVGGILCVCLFSPAVLAIAPVRVEAAAAPPVVRAVGTQLKFANRPFRVYGFNYEFNGSHPNIDYIDHPDRAHLLRVRTDFATAARLGANTVRIFLELHDFMAAPRRVRPRAIRALRCILEEAERARLLVDVTGNLVWHPERSPAWYEALSERGRWRVQARFWRAVAAVGARSRAILCYELTSEPAIGNSDHWYNGVLVHHYVQYVVRNLGTRDGPMLARAWTRMLRDAIRSRDRRHLITIGLLPIRGWAFDPRYVADLLDLVTVHEYPGPGQADRALSLIRYFARHGRPLMLGETFMLDRAAQEGLLVNGRRWLDGSLSFFDGRAPEDVAVGDVSNALYRENLITYLGLRATLRASPRIPQRVE